MMNAYSGLVLLMGGKACGMPFKKLTISFFAVDVSIRDKQKIRTVHITSRIMWTIYYIASQHSLMGLASFHILLESFT